MFKASARSVSSSSGGLEQHHPYHLVASGGARGRVTNYAHDPFGATLTTGAAAGGAGAADRTRRRRWGLRLATRVYTVAFHDLGENMLTIRHDGGRRTDLEFFVTEPLETLIKKRASFIVNRQQIRDTSSIATDLRTKRQSQSTRSRMVSRLRSRIAPEHRIRRFSSLASRQT